MTKITLEETLAIYRSDAPAMTVAGPGLIAPSFFRTTALLDLPIRSSFRVEIDIKMSLAPVPTEVKVSQTDRLSGVTSEVIRQIPVASITTDATVQTMMVADTKGTWLRASNLEIPPGIRDDWPSGNIDEFLWHVSVVYYISQSAASGPTSAVAERFKVSRATAGRMVDAARDAELIHSPSGGLEFLDRVAHEDGYRAELLKKPRELFEKVKAGKQVDPSLELRNYKERYLYATISAHSMHSHPLMSDHG